MRGSSVDRMTLILFAIMVAMIRPTDGVAQSSAPPDQEATWDTLDERMRLEAAEGFSGVLLVERDDAIVHHEGYGLANREAGIAMTPDTVFAVGSVPIDFTHVAILKLMEMGKLNLDDRIPAFFDGVPEDKRRITVEHLMTGASGLPDFHDIPTDANPDHTWIDRDEALRRIFGQRLLFRPGEGRRHSHSAWGLLAAIVEVVSGESYEDFTRTHIYEPAGMRDTGFFGEPIDKQRLAIGYDGESSGEINAPPYWGRTSWLVMGSGGQVSTARDLYRFQEALRDGVLLGEDSVHRFFGPLNGRGATTAGDMFGFWISYSLGPDDKFFLLTNSAGLDDSERMPRLRSLMRELDALVNSAADARAMAQDDGTIGLPADERARRAMQWVQSLNDADPEGYVTFSRTHRPQQDDQDALDASRREQHGEFRERWGELVDLQVVFNIPTRVTVSARSTAEDAWIDFSFQFQTDEPYHIVGIGIQPGSPPG